MITSGALTPAASAVPSTIPVPTAQAGRGPDDPRRLSYRDPPDDQTAAASRNARLSQTAQACSLSQSLIAFPNLPVLAQGHSLTAPAVLFQVCAQGHAVGLASACRPPRDRRAARSLVEARQRPDGRCAGLGSQWETTAGLKGSVVIGISRRWCWCGSGTGP